MFSHIGRKIMTLAKIFCWIGIILSAAGAGVIICRGIMIWNSDTDTAILSLLIGIGVFIVGFLFSWISSFLLYGYGQLIENSEICKHELLRLDMGRDGDEYDDEYDD